MVLQRHEIIEDLLKWTIKCPSCDNVLNIVIQDDDIRFVCNNCDFTNAIPYDWYRISATETIKYLLHNVSNMDELKARQWVNNVKYTHPSYWITQRKERDLARPVFQKVINSVLGEITTKQRIVTVGCNNCIELYDLPFTWDEKNSLGIDLSELSLLKAKENFPKMAFECNFIENVSIAANGYYDLCFALRVLQGSRLELWAALTKIRDLLKPEGWLFISIPKQTILSLGNKFPGIYKTVGGFDEETPKKVVDVIAQNLSDRNSRMYKNVTVFYGGKFDAEYYIAAQKNL